MAHLDTPAKICNAALAMQGENLITSLADGSVEADKLNTVYEGIVRAALTKHGWSFATTLESMTHAASVTSEDWTESWNFPSPANDLLNIQAIIDVSSGAVPRDILDVPGIPFEIRSGLIYNNYSSTQTLKAICQSRVDESEWSDDFADSIVEEIEGVIVAALKRDPERGAAMRDFARKRRELVYTRDRNQSVRQDRDAGPFVEAHRGHRPRPWSPLG